MIVEQGLDHDLTTMLAIVKHAEKAKPGKPINEIAATTLRGKLPDFRKIAERAPDSIREEAEAAVERLAKILGDNPGPQS